MIATTYCLILFVTSMSPDQEALGYEKLPGGLKIMLRGRPMATFFHGNQNIRRPFFANVHGPEGTRLTRNYPPHSGKDATDHATMHPGLWLGFGDISGEDFWRNKATMSFEGTTIEPTLKDGVLAFETRHSLNRADGRTLGNLHTVFSVRLVPSGGLVIWDTTILAGKKELVLGDQEEMGFGARMATELIETKGGIITQPNGKKSARGTWGQPANWTDYSGRVNGKHAGITLMASPSNFRQSWWHNRDYGLMVANPFGRAAMKQGGKSAVELKPGESLRLVFGAVLHEGANHEPAKGYAEFLQVIRQDPMKEGK
jgi:hypothetical protein